MAGRALNKLSHTRVAKLKVAGSYEDGGGLRLVVDARLNKRWVLRVTINGVRRERGLGSFPAVPLEVARVKASEIRTAAKEGKDLAKETLLSAKAGQTTFREAFDEFFYLRQQTLSNGKHVKQWRSTMETYVFPVIGQMPVGDVTARDIIAILSPIWFAKPETARRVLQRMEAVFKSAILRGNRLLASPCIGVAQELGTRHRTVSHHPSLPWQDLPDFLTTLQMKKTVSSATLGLRFLILTAARSGEVRQAQWDEIDFQNHIWNVPAPHMKGRRPHTVPLSYATIDLLQEARRSSSKFGSSLIFPGSHGQILSDMALNKVLRDLGLRGRATPHGFRATFKTWTAEVARVRDEVSEAALAHKIPEKVRAAYLRTQFIEERKSLMRDWGGYVSGSVDQRKAAQAIIAV